MTEPVIYNPKQLHSPNVVVGLKTVIMPSGDSEMNTLRRKYEDLKKKVSELEAERDNLSRENGTLKSHVALLQDQLKEANDEINSLKRKIDKLTKDNAELKTRLDFNDDKFKRMESRIASLEGDKEYLEEQISNAETRYGSLQQNKQKLQLENDTREQFLKEQAADVAESHKILLRKIMTNFEKKVLETVLDPNSYVFCFRDLVEYLNSGASESEKKRWEDWKTALSLGPNDITKLKNTINLIVSSANPVAHKLEDGDIAKAKANIKVPFPDVRHSSAILDCLSVAEKVLKQ